MNYDFSTLSANAFEELTRDLIGRELGIRFEAFPEGRDDGMDGRHSSGEAQPSFGTIDTKIKNAY